MWRNRRRQEISPLLRVDWCCSRRAAKSDSAFRCHSVRSRASARVARCGRITHVVMESTGSYWVPVFNILEGHFIIVLANPEEVKNRKVHKTARKDAENQQDL